MPADAINKLRERILQGDQPSAEEMNQAIKQMRSERGIAAEARETKRKKDNAPPINLADLFGKKEEGQSENP